MDDQPGALIDDLAEGLEPVLQGDQLAAHERQPGVRLDEAHAQVAIPCRQCVVNGFGRQPIALIPLGGAAV